MVFDVVVIIIVVLLVLWHAIFVIFIISIKIINVNVIIGLVVSVLLWNHSSLKGSRLKAVHIEVDNFGLWVRRVQEMNSALTAKGVRRGRRPEIINAQRLVTLFEDKILGLDTCTRKRQLAGSFVDR